MQPLLRWLLKREQSGARLIANLKMASRSYYEKGEVTLRWIRTAAPLMFTLFIGGTLTTLYAVSLFLPITDLMHAIAEEPL